MTTIPSAHTAPWAICHRSCFWKEDRQLKTAGGTGIQGQDQLVVLGCSAGFALTCGGGLEHRITDANESGTGCADDGCGRRRPKDSVIIQSDQGSQFGSDESNCWYKDNRFNLSMSRRGNYWADLVFCHNTVAEQFFSNIKSELVKKRIYSTRAKAKSKILNYI